MLTRDHGINSELIKSLTGFKEETCFTHLETIIKLDRLRLRDPTKANDEFLVAATAQNLCKMAKLYMKGHKMCTA